MSLAVSPYRVVDGVVIDAIERGLTPGAAFEVRTARETLHRGAYGFAEQRPVRRTVEQGTIWDLASLTKVLCTAPLFLTWFDRGELDLSEPINEYVPGVPPEVRIADCLSHSSGYPNWRPIYAQHLRALEHWGSTEIRNSVFRSAAQTPLVGDPGTSYAYSDIGFLLLCAYAERRFGQPLHLLWKQNLPKSATEGLHWGHPDAAATENCPVRRRVIKGQVHDLNAACMGGVSSHAGLFGSCEAAARAAAWPLRNLLGIDHHLESSSVEYFWRYRGAGSHCLGWDTPSAVSSASELWPANGVGHLGFTGCSIWIAPSLSLVAVLLSNRVHPEIPGGATPAAAKHPKTREFFQFRQSFHRSILQHHSHRL